MAIDIAVSTIAAAFVALVIFMVIFLVKLQKTLKGLKNDLHKVTEQAVELMNEVQELTSDIKYKTESLNFAFRPLKALNKSKHKDDSYLDTAAEAVDWVSTSLVLFNKIKEAVKHK